MLARRYVADGEHRIAEELARAVVDDGGAGHKLVNVLMAFDAPVAMLVAVRGSFLVERPASALCR